MQQVFIVGSGFSSLATAYYLSNEGLDVNFYENFTSVTDYSVAPSGKENGLFLIPIAPDLKEGEEIKEQYFNKNLSRLEKHTKQSIYDHILFHESSYVSDFKKDYNSYQGNAYRMAIALRQTAFLQPKDKSRKGQLTVPVLGVPPALISGKVVANQIIKETNKTRKYEPTI